MSQTSGTATLLARQYKEMQKARDLPGISVGLVNNNVFEWEVMLMINDDCKYYGGTFSLSYTALTPLPFYRVFEARIIINNELKQAVTFDALLPSHKHILSCHPHSNSSPRSLSTQTFTPMVSCASRFYTHPRTTNMDLRARVRDGVLYKHPRRY